MRRREFLLLSLTIGCASDRESDRQSPLPDAPETDASDAPPTGDAGVDACVGEVVLMHDTHAQALYLDGTLGPLTGVIRVAMVVASTVVTLDFWHGHGGVSHRFELLPSHFDALKRGERITVGTTTVDGHAHTLFIDPRDETYRVSGAPDVEVSLGCS
ncbi:MAG: hypothetical protein ACKV2T_28750 [Kofleriaceae bacterium]